MTEEERRRAFADAFIRQARSDRNVHRLLLASKDVEACHALHYLQMTCEKLAKAYRLRDTKAPVDDLVRSHAGFAKFVGAYMTVTLKRQLPSNQLAALIRAARKLAREIEKLAPAIDRDVSPVNAEYPWEVDDQVMTPCSYSFPSLELLRQSGGRAFLKLIDAALADFERVTVV